jgi:hypothetical protein
MLADRGPSLSARDLRWQRDIAYLARQLPTVHAGGLTGTTRTDWNAAADRLEAAVPMSSNGQLIAGMARLIAMLRDDETQLEPPFAAFPFTAVWISNSLYLIAVPAADRELLGTRLIAVDGHPIREVLRELQAEIDHDDAGIVRAADLGYGQGPGYLNDADLLYWLGLTSRVASAAFTVADKGTQRSVRLSSVAWAAGHWHMPPMVSVPTPLYRKRANLPYWLQILPQDNAVYLKYNRCVNGHGFQQLAATALRILRSHPRYRLIVDLRDNPGGDSAPFQALIKGIVSDPKINRVGRLFGLINGFTDSAASVDAFDLNHQVHGLLMGQQVADPIDKFLNSDGLLKLPYYGLVVGYTTAVRHGPLLGIPNITISPILQDWLTGRDPVLAAALSYNHT